MTSLSASSEQSEAFKCQFVI